MRTLFVALLILFAACGVDNNPNVGQSMQPLADMNDQMAYMTTLMQSHCPSGATSNKFYINSNGGLASPYAHYTDDANIFANGPGIGRRDRIDVNINARDASWWWGLTFSNAVVNGQLLPIVPGFYDNATDFSAPPATSHPVFSVSGNGQGSSASLAYVYVETVVWTNFDALTTFKMAFVQRSTNGTMQWGFVCFDRLPPAP